MPELIKPPSSFGHLTGKTIFLAGSIEMGTAIDWQTKTGQILLDIGWNVLNPRRDDWDSSWEQSIDNPQFKEQVSWELAGLERADTVLFYFDPNTKSPITLMELGIVSQMKKTWHVICPDGFWRKGNVDVVCERYGLGSINCSIDHFVGAMEKIYAVEKGKL